MQSIYYPASKRGHADHGWLKSDHTFSFGNYFDPSKMGFGVLRVLNDDTVAPGMGFREHAHHNMEIISIPLEGVLEHKDSLGNRSVIRAGDIQVMSAGTGIRHSEFNFNRDKEVRFLQIWIKPEQTGGEPRYGQWTPDPIQLRNKLQCIVSPEGDGLETWIRQNAWLYLGDLDRGRELEYTLRLPKNGLFLFMIEGDLEVNGATIRRRDGIGISQVDQIKIKAVEDCKLLLMEIPV